MNNLNEYEVLLEIFRFIRDYHSGTYTLPDVCRRLIRHMQSSGYEVQITDTSHRDYRIIQVETQRYKIVRNKGWSTYEVIMTA